MAKKCDKNGDKMEQNDDKMAIKWQKMTTNGTKWRQNDDKMAIKWRQNRVKMATK